MELAFDCIASSQITTLIPATSPLYTTEVGYSACLLDKKMESMYAVLIQASSLRFHYDMYKVFDTVPYT